MAHSLKNLATSIPGVDMAHWQLGEREGEVNKSQFCGCNLSSASFGALPLINGAAAVCLSHSDDHDIEGGGWRKGMKGAHLQI